ncbi:hypothetical protein AAIB48_16600 [Paraclostridium benzoelyticum]|uniref:hypothetical protein n=1 Tax=Paraclostridium benzoelyticum TaxID=1629550 RepID=UPI0031CD7E05
MEEDENISFVFYTNTSISKEKKIGVLKDLDIELPDEPVMELLIEKKYDKAFPLILPVFKEYYIKQHNKHININSEEDSGISYYEELINSMDAKQWEKFFGLIEWKFGEDDENELTNTIKSDIEEVCDKLDVEKKYVEKIFLQIIGLIDSKSLRKNFLDKMIHVAEIKLMFNELQRDIKVKATLCDVNNEDKGLDPMYEKWDDVNKEDIRDLEKKILSVCDDFDEDEIEYLQEMLIDGKFEQRKYPDFRKVKAYNYRIYKECNRYIKRLLKTRQTNKFTEEEIDTIMEDMTEKSENIILDKDKTYTMPYRDKDMIRKTILILFEECFIALDKVGEKNE